MAYPEDQGLKIPQFPGWRLVDWFKEPIENGDQFMSIGQNPDKAYNSLPPNTHGKIAIDIWGGAIYSASYCIYRRQPSWVELGQDEILRPMDVITIEGVSPPDQVVMKPRFGAEGWLACHPTGYGEGNDSLKKLKTHYEPKAHKAWRRVGGDAPITAAVAQKRRLPPNPAQLTKPLPLP